MTLKFIFVIIELQSEPSSNRASQKGKRAKKIRISRKIPAKQFMLDETDTEKECDSEEISNWSEENNESNTKDDEGSNFINHYLLNLCIDLMD